MMTSLLDKVLMRPRGYNENPGTVTWPVGQDLELGKSTVRNFHTLLLT